MLTSSDSEKETAERFLGYKFERVLGFCTKEPGCGAYLPLYRFYNAIAKGKSSASYNLGSEPVVLQNGTRIAWGKWSLLTKTLLVTARRFH